MQFHRTVIAADTVLTLKRLSVRYGAAFRKTRRHLMLIKSCRLAQLEHKGNLPRVIRVSPVKFPLYAIRSESHCDDGARVGTPALN